MAGYGGGLVRTRYGAVHDFDPFHQGSDGESARYGGGDAAGDRRPDIFQLGDQVDDRNRQNESTIAAESEALAPWVAKQQNISLDQARSQLSGGVAYDEGPFTKLGHIFGIGEAPAGEAATARAARLRGMASARDFDISEQDRAHKYAMDYAGEPFRQDITNQDAASSLVSGYIRNAGGVLPDDLHFNRPAPKTEVGLYDRSPSDYADYEAKKGEGERLSRAQPAEKKTEFEQAVDDLASALQEQDKNLTPVQARGLATERLRNPGANSSPTQSEGAYQKFISRPGFAEDLDKEDEEAEAALAANPHAQVRRPLRSLMTRLQQQGAEERAGRDRNLLTRTRPDAERAQPDDTAARTGRERFKDRLFSGLDDAGGASAPAPPTGDRSEYVTADPQGETRPVRGSQNLHGAAAAPGAFPAYQPRPGGAPLSRHPRFGG